ncbi:MAG: phage tail tape measure protein [Firmicutes bacterium]|nr:phage tail tape measure protein [Bacillota bacterium]
MAENLGSIYAEMRLKLGELQNDLTELSIKLATAEKEIEQAAIKIGDKAKKNLSNTFNNISKQLEKTGEKIKQVGENIASVGDFMTTTFTVPLAALGGLSFKAAMDFESAFAGVRKTVDATEKELAQLNKGIREMSKRMPASAKEIAGVAEAAGQLGIQTENILSFAETMINLGVATNLSAEQAATALARFANITQMSQKDFNKLGSTIVALGNNLATTEAEIVEMAMRLVGAGAQVGLTEAQIMSFAAALSSVGIAAEAGGSAFSKVMIEMATAVATGGDSLKLFAQVAGMSVKDFKKAFKEDAATAIIAFIEGLGKMSKEGKNVFGILEDLGLSEIRVRDALLRASGAGDLFRQSLELGTQAWKDNIALTKEAEQRYATTESQLQIFKNRLEDIAITLGGPLLTAANNVLDRVSPFVDKVAELAQSFAELDPNIQAAIISAAALIATVGPGLSIFGRMVSGIGDLIGTIGNLGITLSGFLGGLGTFMGYLGMIAALIGLLYLAWKNNFGGIRDITLEVWGQVQEKFRALWETIAPIISDLVEYIKQRWAEIQPYLQPILDWLGWIFGFILKGITETVMFYIDRIVGIIKGAVEVISGIIKFFVAIFTGDWQGAWEAVKQIVNGAIQFLWNFFQIWILGKISGLISKALNTVIGWISGFVSRAIGSFTGWVSRTVGLIGQWASRLVSGGNNAITRFLSAIVRGLANIVSQFGQFVWNSVKTVATLGGRLTNIGRSLVEGLWKGISGMANWLKSKILGWAKAVLPGPIANLLGISSPSKLMMEYGESIAQGLAIGIEKAKKLVESASLQLADITISATGPSLALQGAGGPTVGGPTIVNLNSPLAVFENIQVRDDRDIQSIQTIMRQLYDEAIKSTRARGR